MLDRYHVERLSTNGGLCVITYRLVLTGYNTACVAARVHGSLGMKAALPQ